MRCTILGVPAAAAVFGLALALTAGLRITAPARADPERPRLGVFLVEHDGEAEDALAGLRHGADLARRKTVWIESAGGPDAADAHAALTGLLIENVDVVIAVGDAAALRARDTVRDRPVVFTAVTDAAALELDSSRVCGTESGAPAPAVLRVARRAVVDLQRWAIVTPRGAAAAERLSADLTVEAAKFAAARRLPFTVDSVVPAGETSAERAQSVVGALHADCRLVYLPRNVSAGDAAALAEALAERQIVLVGSLRDHLDAGCAMVLRADARALAGRAYALALAILDGADPRQLERPRPSRCLLEVNLTACHRLGVALPLPLLASADRVTPVYGVAR